ncbi:MAG: transketolase [Sphingobacteriales bacterium]|nr:transketolase [Sphingobacteriales bacterium]MBP9140946.1 transketolase [Chitinophagales bacterium]MDA0198736.1 transketolase [Bacteroidota bacterium]MBK6889358.1 transketolase [Sphingobacteriales bacterium]MBK7528142.1 transketolase [Sphingobacteriales bacterium]
MPELQNFASQVRRDIIRMVAQVNSGHPGGSLGCADFFTILFNNIMRHKPHAFTMDGIGEDLFFLSNGHISPVYYSTLARCGYFDVKELASFRKINSRLQGHPATKEGLPGVRIASGSLGQGLSVAIGAALAKRQNNDPSLVYSLHGDGELQEGQIWEAAMFAAHHKVDNLIATIDWNGQQIDGSNDEVLSLGNLPAKWEAFGWQVLQTNGHDYEALQNTLLKAKSLTNKGQPIVILMRTIMGKGVNFMEGTHKWHGVAPNAEQTQQALAQLAETLGDY